MLHCWLGFDNLRLLLKINRQLRLAVGTVLESEQQSNEEPLVVVVKEDHLPKSSNEIDNDQDDEFFSEDDCEDAGAKATENVEEKDDAEDNDEVMLEMIFDVEEYISSSDATGTTKPRWIVNNPDGLPPDGSFGEETCHAKLLRGHSCLLRCHGDGAPHMKQCLELTKKEPICGHESMVQCSQDLNGEVCSTMIVVKRSCGHLWHTTCWSATHRSNDHGCRVAVVKLLLKCEHRQPMERGTPVESFIGINLV